MAGTTLVTVCSPRLLPTKEFGGLRHRPLSAVAPGSTLTVSSSGGLTSTHLPPPKHHPPPPQPALASTSAATAAAALPSTSVLEMVSLADAKREHGSVRPLQPHCPAPMQRDADAAARKAHTARKSSNPFAASVDPFTALRPVHMQGAHVHFEAAQVHGDSPRSATFQVAHAGARGHLQAHGSAAAHGSTLMRQTSGDAAKGHAMKQLSASGSFSQALWVVIAKSVAFTQTLTPPLTSNLHATAPSGHSARATRGGGSEEQGSAKPTPTGGGRYEQPTTGRVRPTSAARRAVVAEVTQVGTAAATAAVGFGAGRNSARVVPVR
jgi:hypothetical protein